ncbi:superfamily II DNA/RNA helicase [Clostridium algifaecis]|uniref:ATP-dependent RNA helicase DbpA n=1 Tax=Clostridium algifaecis TaxID=1472040 RepID=A0ABS4KVY2_9CLOT|nr:DEAD/DEAH box helicase [Clostridium algifaecis]MBP2034189.1 superfamily II DNA/RNA helicase [Clostridium algifaecis]
MTKLNFKDFELSSNILSAIRKLGYIEPSEVQEKVIPLVLKNNDVIVKSQTGSGKTAAFAIPICEKIELEERDPQVLVLSPTRELSLQIKEDFIDIGRFKRIRCAAIFGKEPVTIQINALKQRVHIVAGTPGRTLDLIDRGVLKLKKIKYLVIDEADEMLNMGFIDQVKSIINRLPKKRATFLFSATMPKQILDLCDKYMINPTNIEIKSKSSVTDRIKQLYYQVEYYNKFDLLNKIIYTERPESSMIFCRTKKNVEDLTAKMNDRNYSCMALHGGMLQADRINVIKSFKRGEFTFLVCTDIAARGLDVENITHIINYDIPMEKESYIHRMGRTGRAGECGTAITFVTPKEYRFLEEIKEYFNLTIEEGKVPTLEEVKKGKAIFKKSAETSPKLKKDKAEKLNKDITKIHLSAGKKKKIRPGDIAGAISSIDGVNPEDVGIIDIQDNFSYVEILSGKGNLVIEGLKDKTIKGKTVRAEKARK